MSYNGRVLQNVLNLGVTKNKPGGNKNANQIYRKTLRPSAIELCSLSSFYFDSKVSYDKVEMFNSNLKLQE